MMGSWSRRRPVGIARGDAPGRPGAPTGCTGPTGTSPPARGSVGSKPPPGGAPPFGGAPVGAIRGAHPPPPPAGPWSAGASWRAGVPSKWAPDAAACGAYGEDFDGRVLVRGDANHRPSCAACRVACEETAGCTVFVWGFLVRSGRYRECWLKAGDGTARKAGSGSPKSPWMSGTVRPTYS
eukprot:TRINITY_DN1096_c0_g1_i9.p2 TRINITY_DN1096_c0_g1~~TRINITY_DN1096_c0_g1_i9.p2  ORF type:complete len:181 (+),score=15.05 TRINITY_DN1096_c0_g1_i9:116-658(+)